MEGLPSYEAAMREAKAYLRRRDLNSHEEVPLYFAWERLYASANANLSVDFLTETSAERKARQQARLAPRQGLPPPLLTSFDKLRRTSMHTSAYLRSGTPSSASIEMLARRYRREAEKLRCSRDKLVASLDDDLEQTKRSKRRLKTREFSADGDSERRAFDESNYRWSVGDENPESSLAGGKKSKRRPKAHELDEDEESEQLQAFRSDKGRLSRADAAKVGVGATSTFDSLLLTNNPVSKKTSLRQTSRADDDLLRSTRFSNVENIAAFAAKVSAAQQSDLVAQKLAGAGKRKAFGSMDGTNELRNAIAVAGGDADTTFDTSLVSSDEMASASDNLSDRSGSRSAGSQLKKSTTGRSTTPRQGHLGNEMESTNGSYAAERGNTDNQKQRSNGGCDATTNEQKSMERKQQRRVSGVGGINNIGAGSTAPSNRQFQHKLSSMQDAIDENQGDEMGDIDEGQAPTDNHTQATANVRGTNLTNSSKLDSTREATTHRYDDALEATNVAYGATIGNHGGLEPRGSAPQMGSQHGKMPNDRKQQQRDSEIARGDAIASGGAFVAHPGDGYQRNDAVNSDEDGESEDEDGQTPRLKHTMPTTARPRNNADATDATRHFESNSVGQNENGVFDNSERENRLPGQQKLQSNRPASGRQASSDANGVVVESIRGDSKAFQISSRAVGEVKVQVNGQQIVFTFDGALANEAGNYPEPTEAQEEYASAPVSPSTAADRQPSVLEKVFDRMERQKQQNASDVPSDEVEFLADGAQKTGVRFSDSPRPNHNGGADHLPKHNGESDLEPTAVATESMLTRPSETSDQTSGLPADRKKRQVTEVEIILEEQSSDEESEQEVEGQHRDSVNSQTGKMEFESEHIGRRLRDSDDSNLTRDRQESPRSRQQEGKTRRGQATRGKTGDVSGVNDNEIEENSHHPTGARDGGRQRSPSSNHSENNESNSDSDVARKTRRPSSRTNLSKSPNNQDTKHKSLMDAVATAMVEQTRRSSARKHKSDNRRSRRSEESFDENSAEDSDSDDDENLTQRHRPSTKYERDERRKSSTTQTQRRSKTRDSDLRGSSSSKSRRAHTSRNQQEMVIKSGSSSEDELSEELDTPEDYARYQKNHRHRRSSRHRDDKFSGDNSQRRRSHRSSKDSSLPETTSSRSRGHRNHDHNRAKASKFVVDEPERQFRYRSADMESPPKSRARRGDKEERSSVRREIGSKHKSLEGIVWPPGMEEECIARLGLDGHHPIAPPGLEHLVTEEQWGEYWTWLHWYSSWQMWYMKSDKKPQQKSRKDETHEKRRHKSDRAEYEEQRAPKNANWWLDVGDAKHRRR